MRRVLRWLGLGVAGILSLLLLALVVAFLVSEYRLRPQDPELRRVAVSNAPAAVAHGERLSSVFGCTACHGRELAGQALAELPDGSSLHATNLTRLSSYGSEQLEAAIRQGMRSDGRPLLIMPSGIYSRMSDRDVGAIISYLRTLEPRGSESPNRWFGPIARLGIASGMFETAPAKVEQAKSMQPFWTDKAHEQGRYLASVTCAACHNFDLRGHEDGAPDLTLAGAYDAAAFRRLMRTGVGTGNRQLGEMTEVAREHFSKFSDAEIDQLHAYLVARAERVAR